MFEIKVSDFTILGGRKLITGESTNLHYNGYLEYNGGILKVNTPIYANPRRHKHTLEVLDGDIDARTIVGQTLKEIKSL